MFGLFVLYVFYAVRSFHLNVRHTLFDIVMYMVGTASSTSRSSTRVFSSASPCWLLAGGPFFGIAFFYGRLSASVSVGALYAAWECGHRWVLQGVAWELALAGGCRWFGGWGTLLCGCR